MGEENVLLKVENLRINLRLRDGETVSAVQNLNFEIQRGKVFCIVGESGCGKSLTASAIMGLLPRGVGYIGDGKILLDGEDIAHYSPRQMDRIRGKKITMIFQEPMTSLDPVYRVGKQMVEMLRAHNRNISQEAARQKCIAMLEKVGIPDPELRFDEYPHELSGGMRQRVMIAMAMLPEPELLIADEPTTALDVTIQAQILDLMKELSDSTGTAVLLITHDMGVVAQMADEVLVMYAGNTVEYGEVRDIFKNPLHPYTNGLLRSIPRPDEDSRELYTIEGTVPPLQNLPKGCHFCTRCPYCMEKCRVEAPPLSDVGSHKAACWKLLPENGQYQRSNEQKILNR